MGNERAIKEGRWINRPKTGYDLLDGCLVPNADATRVREVCELCAERHSYRSIEEQVLDHLHHPHVAHLPGRGPTQSPVVQRVSRASGDSGNLRRGPACGSPGRATIERRALGTSALRALWPARGDPAERQGLGPLLVSAAGPGLRPTGAQHERTRSWRIARDDAAWPRRATPGGHSGTAVRRAGRCARAHDGPAGRRST